MIAPAVTTVRAWIPDVWDVIDVEVEPGMTVAEVKAAVLRRALGTGPRADPDRFIVKYRGALVDDEQVTLGALQVPDRAPFIVLPARRRPVT